MLHDNGQTAPSRILIFATDDGLEQLTSKIWYVDGNFKLAPPYFQQLYVIRVRKDDLCVTSVYCFLQHKSQQTYEYVYKILLEECAARDIYLDPEVVYMDFEKGAINAVKNMLGQDIKIQGCFYHLAQSVHRKIQMLGLQSEYKQNQQFTMFCSRINALAFLKADDVINGMQYLKGVTPPSGRELLDYFDSTYVTGTFKRVQNARGRITLKRVKPMYPPETWNVRDAVLTKEEKTNNQTEGWNNRFKNLVGHTHPGIYPLIEKMGHETLRDNMKIGQKAMGLSVKKKKKDKFETMQEKLFNLCTQHEAGQKTREEFLKSIAYAIRSLPIS